MLCPKCGSKSRVISILKIEGVGAYRYRRCTELHKFASLEQATIYTAAEIRKTIARLPRTVGAALGTSSGGLDRPPEGPAREGD